MPKAKVAKIPNIMVGQRDAHKFVTDYMGKNIFPIPAEMMEEDQFNKLMDSIFRAMMASWTDGFVQARD